jgi:hypothetical protein
MFRGWVLAIVLLGVGCAAEEPLVPQDFSRWNESPAFIEALNKLPAADKAAVLAYGELVGRGVKGAAIQPGWKLRDVITAWKDWEKEHQPGPKCKEWGEILELYCKELPEAPACLEGKKALPRVVLESTPVEAESTCAAGSLQLRRLMDF